MDIKTNDALSQNGNIFLASAVLFSGNTFSRITEMMKIVNISFFPHTLYLRYRKTLLFPLINHIYKQYQRKTVHNCRNIALDLLGDDHSDFPGFNAKYGTYTLINFKTHQIIDCHVDHVALAGNSARMEKRGSTILLEKFRRIGIIIKSLTTDRHVQIRPYVAKEHPDILYQFDVWHVRKTHKKALFKPSKSKDCEELEM